MQKHLSEWYSDKLNYSGLMEEDYFIRSKVEDFFNEFFSIFEIDKTLAFGFSVVSVKYFATLNNSKGNLKRFTTLLLKRNVRNLIRFLQLRNEKNYYVGIKFIKNPFELFKIDKTLAFGFSVVSVKYFATLRYMSLARGNNA